MRILINLFLNLPWWGFLAVAAGLAGIGYGLSWWMQRRFNRILREAVLEMGSSLRDATVEVHSVAAVAAPKEPSPYDAQPDDEDFAEGMDGRPWDEPGVAFYRIDATISPAIPGTKWDPTGLAVVPADFQAEDATDVCLEMGGLHSAEIFRNGRFEPAREGEVQGPQRVRMLFGIGEKERALKFASGVHYFGKVVLPTSRPQELQPA